MGGHELDRLGGNEAICDHMIELSGKEAPKVCLLPTASGDPEDQIGRFTRAFGSRGCEVTDISLFRLGANPIDVSAHLLSQDLIYVGGGNAKHLKATDLGPKAKIVANTAGILGGIRIWDMDQ